MAEDASNAATPITAKIAFGFVLMFLPHVLRFSSRPLNKARLDGLKVWAGHRR